MARPALRTEDVEAFRRRTVDAATRLFAERGYDGVTLRAIATELGTSAMAPYRYFENKEEIFALVRAEAFGRFADDQQRAFETTDEPLSRLLAMRQAYLDSALARPDEYRVMFELRGGPDHPALAEQNQRSFRVLLQAVEAAIDTGTLRGDARTTAHLLWASVHGLISLHLAGKLTLGCTLELLWNAPPVVFTDPVSEPPGALAEG